MGVANPNGWVEVLEKPTNRTDNCKCKCLLCGDEFFSRYYHVLSGAVKSCGCLARYRPNQSLEGRETEVGVVFVGYVGEGLWKALFTCGHTEVKSTTQIKNSKTGLCSVCAWHLPTTLKHGHKRGGKATPTYSSFESMLRRCLGEYNNRYYNYGARGIDVCERWKDKVNGFVNFLKDMGERPLGHSLERRNVFQGYSPENCCWIEDGKQGSNKTTNVRVVLEDGSHASLRDYCLSNNLDYKACWYRMRIKGENPQQVLGVPLRVIFPENFKEEDYSNENL